MPRWALQATYRLRFRPLGVGQYEVDVKGSTVDVKGAIVDVKSSTVDVKGYIVDGKGYIVDVKGSIVDVKGLNAALGPTGDVQAAVPPTRGRPVQSGGAAGVRHAGVGAAGPELRAWVRGMLHQPGRQAAVVLQVCIYIY